MADSPILSEASFPILSPIKNSEFLSRMAAGEIVTSIETVALYPLSTETYAL